MPTARPLRRLSILFVCVTMSFSCLVNGFGLHLPFYQTGLFKYTLRANILTDPQMFNFEVMLGSDLGRLVAFASGLTLFEREQYQDAEPLFTEAARETGLISSDFEQAIYYYRGTNYLSMHKINEAKCNLQNALQTESVSESNEQPHSATPSVLIHPLTLNNLGVVYYALDQQDEALSHLQLAADNFAIVGAKYNELNSRESIAALHFREHRYADSALELEKATDIAEQIRYPRLEELQSILEFVKQSRDNL